MVNIKDFIDTPLYEEYTKNRDYIKNISWYTLPNKPSQLGYSANDIKRKAYEPILQLYDWLYGEIGENIKLRNEYMSIFKIDINALKQINIINAFRYNYKIETTLFENQIDTIKEYLKYKYVKSLLVEINGIIVVLNSEVKENENEYKIVGIGVDLESDHLIEITLTIDKTTRALIGYIEDFNLNGEEITNILNTYKSEILEEVKRDFVPKTDIQEIVEFEEGEEPLTQGGYIKINTYN